MRDHLPQQTDDIATRVRAVITEVLGEPNPADPQRLMIDIGADSLEMAELAMVLEEEFAVEIPDLEAREITTVAELITLVRGIVG